MNFSITEILREIKIGGAGVLKMPFFAILKPLNVDLLVNFSFQKVLNCIRI